MVYLYRRMGTLMDFEQMVKTLAGAVFFLLVTSVAWSASDARIIGGRPATSDYDFFVSIMTQYEWAAGQYHWNSFCGGSYIGDNTVVTAAHCVTDASGNVPLSNFTLLIGDYSDAMQAEYCSDDPSDYDCITRDSKELCVPGYHYTGFIAYTGDESNLITVSPSNITVHENYDPVILENDIALIHLNSAPANTPVNLPTVDEFQSAAQSSSQVRVIGHGDVISDTNSSTFEQSSELLEVDITARTDAICTTVYGSGYSSESMICAGDAGKDSCQGDSGGPLITSGASPHVLLGIVSKGAAQCGKAGTFGVYTDIYQFNNTTSWIEQNKRAALPDSGGLRTTSNYPLLATQSRVALTDGCDPIAVIASDGTVYRMGRQAGAMGLAGLAGLILLLWRRQP